MATDIKGISIAAQDQVLAAITTTQAAILDGVRTWTSSVASAMPKLPSIPGLDKLPSPSDGIELGFDFATRLLATQREFAMQLLSATAAPAQTSASPKVAKSKV